MNHITIQDKLFDFYDGELSSDEMKLMQQHVSSCSECKNQLLEWRRLSQAFFAPPPLVTSETFVQRVMDEIEGEQPSKVRHSWFVPALGFGFATALFLFGFLRIEPLIGTDDLLFDENTASTTTSSDVGTLLEL